MVRRERDVPLDGRGDRLGDHGAAADGSRNPAFGRGDRPEARTGGADAGGIPPSRLPLAIPGVLVAAVLGFARSLGEFGATITFVSNIPGETRTLPIAIYSALQVPGGEGIVTRLAIISVILSLGALVASEALARRGGAGARGHVL
jgi:molybdate transport system permease protein